MRIVTSGARYLDIDAYAGMIAYAELLKLQGVPAEAVGTTVLNASISETVLSWQAPLKTEYVKDDTDTFTLIDVSEPGYLDQIVDLDRVDEVIDHHSGFERFWRERIGDKAHLEFIGAACTLIYERWKAASLVGEMSELSAKLLATGILDNTLDFKAKITTDRDKAAYADLAAHAKIDQDWSAQYFSECQKDILADVPTAIRDDSKTLAFETFPRLLSVGQLVLWNGAEIIQNHQALAEKVLSAVKPDWFMNVVSIAENRSYLLCVDPEIQTWLAQLLDVKFEGSVAIADRSWLRKEILKQETLKQKTL